MTSIAPSAGQQPQMPPIQRPPLTASELDDLTRRVDKAKVLLIVDHPFFGVAVSKREIQYDYNIPTAAMSATGQMYLNPSWAYDLNVKQLMFLLAHEAMHFMLGHSLRKGWRKPMPWNIACDKVINDTLLDAKVGEFIDGGINEEGARDQAAEQLYDENEDWGSAGGGIGDDIGDTTDENGNQLSPEQLTKIEVQTQVELIQAAKVAKQIGNLPSGVERIVEELVKVHTPWHEILERYMNGKVKDDYSWSRPNRRFVTSGLYLPSSDYVPKMGEVVIGVDTSGSIGPRELAEFNAHIDRIIEGCNPEKVHVVYCDYVVNHTETFEPDDFPVKLHPHGGGGTRFNPVFDWVAEQGIEPDVLVYLTDGDGNQADVEQPPYDTVWLTTHNTEFPWGEVIEFKPEN
jgi:predicted metal-dependent peptidase